MKNIVILSLFLLLNACGSNNHISEASDLIIVTGDEAENYANSINAEKLKEHLYILASDEYEGRDTGEPGQKKAAEYIKNFYILKNITSPFGDKNYYQVVPTAHLKPNLKPSENVLAYIKGTEKPDELIVISAHYDHIGAQLGEIYNGADDNGSGTVAIMAIAEAFKKATLDGKGPKRSILFLHVTGEEKGLLGSKYYTNFPVFPLAKTVTNFNIDMIGRIDDTHENGPNYVYIIGSDKLSTELHHIHEKINEKFTNISLDYKYNDNNDPNRFYYRSDHYNFAKNNIPVIFYFSGLHQDYHKPSDTPDKINYDFLEKRTKLIFYTTWEIANRDKKISLDK